MTDGIILILYIDDDVLRSHSYGVYVSRRSRFARVLFDVNDFSSRKTL